MAEPRRRRSISQALLLELLTEQLAGWRPAGNAPVRVVDVGGGTGVVAGELAAQGYIVTVVDPSPDALASLERRAREAGLADRLTGLQGDTAGLVELVGRGSADVVVCHRVLEVVDSPADALAGMAAVLQSGGVLSLAVAQRQSLVLAQALAGHFAQARRTAADRTRFDYQQIRDLVHGAGFQVVQCHGIGAVADHVAESLIDADAAAYAELLALESEISQDPAFRALAPLLHLFARVA